MGYEMVSRSTRAVTGSLLGLGLLAAPCAATLAAEVSVGAGIRTSFASDSVSDTSDFALNSARIYLSGKATDDIGFMFNTEYKGTNSIDVIDAAATFAFSDTFNIWAGRFLPPSDRANMYGPYYASDWAPYVDGIGDGYPTGHTGRADGVMYWGQFGGAKLSAGVFDTPATLGSDKLLGAARLQYDFWDSEGGYYLNGSYYGAKDLLALGIAAQTSDSETALTIDALLEKKLAGGGVVTLEAEYADYDNLAGSNQTDGYYALAAYLFPQVVGIGKFQVLGKYGTADLGGPKLDTLELNLNYIIKDQNAAIHLFYLDQDIGGTKVTKTIGVGLQVQM
jgi:hypothetical protein